MATDHVPYVPESRILPEITPKGVALAVILAMVLTAANVYLGLYVGMTVSASIPAAVLSMGMLRAIAAAFPRQETNILENNWVQTAVSAGESLAAGVIFTLPALIVLGTWEDFAFFPVFITAAVGGTIGVLFSISLRRIFIIQERLPYPEGVACAEVLVAGEKGGTQVLPIIAGMGFGAISKLGAALEIVVDGVLRKVSLGLWRNSWHDHFTFQGRLPEFGTVTQSRTTFFFGIELSPALLGVGYIVGPMIGSFVFLGGFLGALVVLPLTSGLLLPPEGMSIGDFVGFIEMRRRMVGVGTMLIGGLYTLVLMRGPVIKGIRDMLEKANASEDRSGLSRTDLDLDPQIVSRLSLAMALPMALMVWWISGLILPALLALLIVFSAGYLFAAIAGYMAGLLGSSNNPISGVTIIVVIFTASLFTLLNWLVYDGAHTQDLVVATIGVAAFVCCAGAISGDNLQDLKTGNIVGATPWRQQVAQLVGVLAGALVIPLVLNLLISTYELGKDLAAPQAFLMAALASGILEGTMDWAMVLLGAGIDAGSGIVKDQDRRVHQDGAGDRQALALPSGEFNTALTDNRVIPIIQSFDKIVHVCCPGCLHDFLIRRLRASIGDVLPDGIVKEKSFLGYQSKVLPQRFQRKLRDIRPVYQYFPGHGVMKTEQEVNQGGFPGSAHPHNGEHLRFFNAHVYITQNQSVSGRILE